MRSQRNTKRKRRLRRRPQKLRILKIISEIMVDFEKGKKIVKIFVRAAKYIKMHVPLYSLFDILILCYASNSMDSMNAGRFGKLL